MSWTASSEIDAGFVEAIECYLCGLNFMFARLVYLTTRFFAHQLSVHWFWQKGMFFHFISFVFENLVLLHCPSTSPP